MAKPPAFQWYARDWLSDPACRMLDPYTRAAYGDLLSVQWLEGAIPSDLSVLDRLLTGYGYDPDLVDHDSLLDLFPNGKNRRMERERKAQQDRKKKAVEYGKEGARKRWQKPDIDRVPIDTPLGFDSTASATASATATNDVLSERAAPDVENSEYDTIYTRLGPHARKLNPDRDEQNKWIAWAKLQKTDLDTLESWLGGLVLLRDKRCLEWIAPDEPVTCKVYEKFPVLRSQAEGAWAKYGPGSVGEHRLDIPRLQA